MTQHGARGLSHTILLATLELQLYTFVQALEQRYSPDQPRVPAGNADGGQWTGVGGLGGGGASIGGTAVRREPASIQVAQLANFSTCDRPGDKSIGRSSGNP
ncbi:MAG: hypothetical protein ABI377_09980 [Devosia sp.]